MGSFVNKRVGKSELSFLDILEESKKKNLNIIINKVRKRVIERINKWNRNEFLLYNTVFQELFSSIRRGQMETQVYLVAKATERRNIVQLHDGPQIDAGADGGGPGGRLVCMFRPHV